MSKHPVGTTLVDLRADGAKIVVGPDGLPTIEGLAPSEAALAGAIGFKHVLGQGWQWADEQKRTFSRNAILAAFPDARFPTLQAAQPAPAGQKERGVPVQSAPVQPAKPVSVSPLPTASSPSASPRPVAARPFGARPFGGRTAFTVPGNNIRTQAAAQREAVVEKAVEEKAPARVVKPVRIGTADESRLMLDYGNGVSVEAAAETNGQFRFKLTHMGVSRADFAITADAMLQAAREAGYVEADAVPAVALAAAYLRVDRFKDTVALFVGRMGSDQERADQIVATVVVAPKTLELPANPHPVKAVTAERQAPGRFRADFGAGIVAVAQVGLDRMTRVSVSNGGAEVMNTILSGTGWDDETLAAWLRTGDFTDFVAVAAEMNGVDGEAIRLAAVTVADTAPVAEQAAPAPDAVVPDIGVPDVAKLAVAAPALEKAAAPEVPSPAAEPEAAVEETVADEGAVEDESETDALVSSAESAMEVEAIALDGEIIASKAPVAVAQEAAATVIDVEPIKEAEKVAPQDNAAFSALAGVIAARAASPAAEPEAAVPQPAIEDGYPAELVIARVSDRHYSIAYADEVRLEVDVEGPSFRIHGTINGVDVGTVENRTRTWMAVVDHDRNLPKGSVEETLNSWLQTGGFRGVLRELVANHDATGALSAALTRATVRIEDAPVEVEQAPAAPTVQRNAFVNALAAEAVEDDEDVIEAGDVEELVAAVGDATVRVEDAALAPEVNQAAAVAAIAEARQLGEDIRAWDRQEAADLVLLLTRLDEVCGKFDLTSGDFADLTALPSGDGQDIYATDTAGRTVLWGEDGGWRVEAPVLEAASPEAQAPHQEAAPPPAMGEGGADVADAAVRVADPAMRVETVRVVNDFQVAYAPGSEVGTPTAMVPKGLDGATREAIRNLQAKLVEAGHGGIDAYVANNLGLTYDQMAVVLSPEQVDAVAFALWNNDNGRAMMVADATGLGKGRIMAAIIRANALAGRNTVFVTEKAVNIDDMWRDLRDIGADADVRPLVLAENSAIHDVPLNHDKAAVNAMIQERDDDGRWTWPDGINVVFTVYSQFNNLNSERAQFIRAAVGPAQAILLDEAHNLGTGGRQSNTAQNVGAAVESAGQAVFSTATPVKSASMFRNYKRLLPPTFTEERINGILKSVEANGESGLEAMADILGKEGVWLCRQHDAANAYRRSVLDQGAHERNVRIADSFAAVMSAATRNDLIKRGDANFFQTLLMTALKVDAAIETAATAIREGRKPVIFIQNTNESMLTGNGMPDFKDLLRAKFGGRSARVDALIAQMPDLPANFIDAIKFGLAERGIRSGEISGRGKECVLGDDGGYMVRRRVRDDRGAITAFNGGAAANPLPTEDRLDCLILTSAGSTGISLHASPTFGDQSPREMIILQPPLDPNRDLQMMGRVNRRGQVADPTITTLHVDLPVDMRQFAMRNTKFRRMAAASTGSRDTQNVDNEIPDIINRVGDWSALSFLRNHTDIAAELGFTGRDLKIDEATGEVSISANDSDNDGLCAVLMSRLGFLSVDRQEECLDELIDTYRARIEELDRRGENPLRAKEVEGEGTLVSRVIYDGMANPEETRFNDPVFLETWQMERDQRPKRPDWVLEHLQKANHRATERYLSNQDVSYKIHTDRAAALIAAMPEGQRDIQQANAALRRIGVALDRRYEHAKNGRGPYDALLERLEGNGQENDARLLRAFVNYEERKLGLSKLIPGRTIAVEGFDGTKAEAVILSVTPPKLPQDMHQGDLLAAAADAARQGQALFLRRPLDPENWSVTYIRPGDEQPTKAKLSTLLEDRTSPVEVGPRWDDKLLPGADGVVPPNLRDRMEQAVEGRVKYDVLMLTGNTIEAMRAANGNGRARLGFGARIQGTDGQFRNGVAIKRERMASIEKGSFTLPPGLAVAVLREKATVLHTLPAVVATEYGEAAAARIRKDAFAPRLEGSDLKPDSFGLMPSAKEPGKFWFVHPKMKGGLRLSNGLRRRIDEEKARIEAAYKTTHRESRQPTPEEIRSPLVEAERKLLNLLRPRHERNEYGYLQTDSRSMRVSQSAAEAAEAIQAVEALGIQFSVHSSLRKWANEYVAAQGMRSLQVASPVDDFFAAEGKLGEVRAQAAARFPLFKEVLATDPTLKAAVDAAYHYAMQRETGTPVPRHMQGVPSLEDAVAERFGLSRPMVNKLGQRASGEGHEIPVGDRSPREVAEALATLDAGSGGKGLLNWFPGEVAKDKSWAGVEKCWNAFLAVYDVVKEMSAATGIPAEDLYSGSKGDWESFHKSLATAWTHADDLKRIKEEGVSLEDSGFMSHETGRAAALSVRGMVEDFARRVVMPLAAHNAVASGEEKPNFKGNRGNETFAKLTMDAERVAARVLFEGMGAKAIIERARHHALQVHNIADAAVGNGGGSWHPLCADAQAPNGLFLTVLTKTNWLRNEGHRGNDEVPHPRSFYSENTRTLETCPGLNHCVGGYTESCESGRSHIVSIGAYCRTDARGNMLKDGDGNPVIVPNPDIRADRVYVNGMNEDRVMRGPNCPQDVKFFRLSTAEFRIREPGDNDLHLIQNQARGNTTPCRDARDACTWFMERVSHGDIPVDHREIERAALAHRSRNGHDLIRTVCGYTWQLDGEAQRALEGWNLYLRDEVRQAGVTLISQLADDLARDLSPRRQKREADEAARLAREAQARAAQATEAPAQDAAAETERERNLGGLMEVLTEVDEDHGEHRVAI